MCQSIRWLNKQLYVVDSNVLVEMQIDIQPNTHKHEERVCGSEKEKANMIERVVKEN